MDVNLVCGQGRWDAQEQSVDTCLVPREDLLAVPQPDGGYHTGEEQMFYRATEIFMTMDR